MLDTSTHTQTYHPSLSAISWSSIHTSWPLVPSHISLFSISSHISLPSIPSPHSPFPDPSSDSNESDPENDPRRNSPPYPPTVLPKMHNTIKFIQMVKKATLPSQFTAEELTEFFGSWEHISTLPDNPSLKLSLLNYISFMGCA